MFFLVSFTQPINLIFPKFEFLIGNYLGNRSVSVMDIKDINLLWYAVNSYSSPGLMPEAGSSLYS